MADTPEKEWMDNLAPGRNEQNIIDRVPARLTGDLAAGTTIAAGASASEKIKVKGATRVRVRYKLTGTGLDETVEIIPVLADESTEATTDKVSASDAVSATEKSLTFEPWGEKYVVIKITNNHGSENLTVDYVEVSLL